MIRYTVDTHDIGTDLLLYYTWEDAQKHMLMGVGSNYLDAGHNTDLLLCIF